MITGIISILTFDYLPFNMKRLEVPLKGLNVHLRTNSVWPFPLKGLSKLIKQNLHLELIGCRHLEIGETRKVKV